MKGQCFVAEILKDLHSWLDHAGCDNPDVQNLVNRYVLWKVSTRVDAMIARRERRGKPIQLQHKILKVFRDHLSATKLIVRKGCVSVLTDWCVSKALAYVHESEAHIKVTIDDTEWKAYKSKYPIPVAFSVEAYRELESLLFPYSKEEINIALNKVYDIIDSWFGANVTRNKLIPFRAIAKMLVSDDEQAIVKAKQGNRVISLVLQEMEALLNEDLDEDSLPKDKEKDTADRKESKKDTSEVNEDSSKSGSKVHGGDHASGEVKDSVNAYDKGDSNRHGSRPGFSKNAWKKQVDKQLSKVFKKLLCKDREDNDLYKKQVLKDSYGLTVKKGSGGSSVACTFSFDDVQISEESKKHAKKLSDLIAQKAKAVLSIAGDTTPLLDTKKLAVEVASRRYNISRCKKDGKTNDLVILMADVSGSCSAAAPATTAAIAAVAMQNENILAIVHSNGWPYEMFFNGEYIDLVNSLEWPTDFSLYTYLVKKFNVKMVIAFGDADAIGAYKVLSKCCDLYWLDSYCASYGYGIGKREQVTRGDVELMNTRSVHTAWGVNDVVSAYETLKVLFKK